MHLDSWISIDWMNFNKFKLETNTQNQKDMVNALSNLIKWRLNSKTSTNEISTQINYKKQHVKVDTLNSVYYALQVLKHSKSQKKKKTVNYSFFPDK